MAPPRYEIRIRGRLSDSLLARFELDPRKKCRTYSKGNRQKVALVAALAFLTLVAALAFATLVAASTALLIFAGGMCTPGYRPCSVADSATAGSVSSRNGTPTARRSSGVSLRSTNASCCRKPLRD